MSKIAFLFPGLGAQSVGMGQTLAEALPSARALFDSASDILGYDLAEICFSGPVDRLNSTVVSQPAIYVTSLAALESLKASSREKVEQCEGAAGLSLGEYTALVFAGVMSFEDGLRLVQQRGEAMQMASDATPSGMVSVLGLEPDVVERLCEEHRGDGEVLRIANYLCPGNLAVSGSRAACERLTEAAEAAGAMKVVPLAVAGAFHSSLMQPAVERLSSALANVSFAAPRIPVILNVTGRPSEDPESIRQTLIRQVVEPVQWEESMRWMLAEGYGQFFEVGPGRVLRGLLRRMDRKLPCESVLG
ncbi:MAG: ACP S-malonyltransferase [Planctomycetales bacterium]|nr:ACP S-malonyltransferase [Planctomycetales bacterium]